MLVLLSLVHASDTIPDVAVDGQLYRPPMDAEATLWADDTSLHQGFSGGLVLGWVHEPVVWVWEDTGERVPLVADAAGLDLLAAYTFGRIRAGLDLPVYPFATGQSGSGAGLGDIAVDVKGVLLDRSKAPLGLAISARADLPTASAPVPLAAEGFAYEVAVVADRSFGPVLVAANIGTRGMPSVSDVENIEIGPQLAWRVGAGFVPGTTWGASVDLAGYATWNDLANAAGAPAEAMVGGWVNVKPDLRLSLGVGHAISSGIGASSGRAVAGVSWRPAAKGVQPTAVVKPVAAVQPKPAAKPAPAVAPPVFAPAADAKKTKSGLSYKVITKGTGKAHPRADQLVEVHYTGWSKDGVMFDSSVARGTPATFPVARLIPGWTEGLQLMVAGDKVRFWIPSALAYGDTATRPGAPSGDLTFDIELLSFKDAPVVVAAPPPVVVAAPPPKPPAPAATAANPVVVVKNRLALFQGVTFDGVALKAGGRTQLDAVAAYLHAHSEIESMRIEGHTGGGGDPSEELSLAGSRAGAVMEYLVAAGIDRARFFAAGYGSMRPLNPGTDDAARAINDRIEFVVTRWAEGKEPR